MLLPVPRSRYPWKMRILTPPQSLVFRAHAAPPAISPALPDGSRDHSRSRAGQALRGPRERGGAPGGRRRAPAGAVAEQPALLGGEPEAVRVLPRTARPERPERLPALRPAAAGRGALTSRPLALLVAALLAAGLLSGCGGDDESAVETTPTVPDLNVPEPPAPTTETVPPSTDGGTPAPEPEPEPEPPTDAPENDTPPPTDSPAERFEEYCNNHPGACG